MGLTPSDVRAMSPSDFLAFYDGYAIAKGLKSPNELSALEARELRQELWPDE